MADVQVLAPGVKAAPLAYTVPGAQEIIVKAAFATFDGSGAASAYLPCLRLVAPSGKVVGEYITDETVAAAGSAEVSWAPFLRGAGGGVTLTPRIWWFGGVGNTNGQTIPDSVETLLTANILDGPGIGDGAGVEFGDVPQEVHFYDQTVQPSAHQYAAQTAVYARLSLLWFNAFAGYRYIKFAWDAPAGAVSNMLELVIPLVDQQDTAETSRRQFQRLERLVPPFVFVAARYLRLRCYVYQESGAPQDTSAWQTEVYGLQDAHL